MPTLAQDVLTHSFVMACKLRGLEEETALELLCRDTTPEGEAAVRCAHTSPTRTLAQLVPEGWYLVSSDLLASLDPKKPHPFHMTHWHRSLAQPVRAFKWMGVRWICAFADIPW